MRILLSYPTDVGIFDIGQTKDRIYHLIFDEEVIADYSSIDLAVTDLVNNKVEVFHPETNESLDTSKLGIASDYREWDTNY